jgi:hypothetical protein
MTRSGGSNPSLTQNSRKSSFDVLADAEARKRLRAAGHWKANAGKGIGRKAEDPPSTCHWVDSLAALAAIAT